VKTIQQMKDRWAEVIRLADDLRTRVAGEERPLTEAEAGEVQKNIDEAATLTRDIRFAEEIEKNQRALNAPVPRVTDPIAPAAGDDAPARRSIITVGTGHSLRAFRPRRGETHAQMEERAHLAGRWILGQLFRQEQSAQWCREHGVQIRAASEGVNALGGFLVPDQFAASVIDLREQYGAFRQNAKIEPMTSDTKSVPRRTGGLTAYAVGENTEITESTKGWDKVQLSAKKFGVLSKYSSELSDDAAISIADDLAQEAGYAFAIKEDQCGINGDGTSTYHGTVGFRTKMIDGNHAASYATAPGAGNSCDTWDEVGDDDLNLVISALPGYALARGPKWFCPIGATHAIFGRLLRAAGGATLAELAAGVPQRYAGFPVVGCAAWTDTPSTDNSGKIIVAFGCLDLAATMGDRREIRMKVSSDRFIELDELVIVATERVDINVHDIGNASTAGPLVGLYGN